MAIKKELYNTREDAVKLYRSYSDKGLKIQKKGTNEYYDEAIDVESANYEYIETDQKVEDLNEFELKAKAYDILIGEAE
jgi:hypothetical protein